MSRRVAPLLLGTLACAAGLAACTAPSPAPHAPGAGAAGPRSHPAAAAVPLPHIQRLATTARQGSGVLLADLEGRRVAYVADEDASLVRVIDLETEREISSLAPGGAPTELVMLADGRLVVSLRDAAKLAVLRGGGTGASRLVVDTTIDVAAEPIGLALSPDDATLVATSGWGRTVTVLDAHTFVRKVVHPVAREPRTVVIAADGKRAFVAHAVGQDLDVLPLDGSPPQKPLSLGGIEETSGRMMFIGAQSRMACQGFALARTESGRILAPHVLVFPGEQEVSEGYGGGPENREAELFHVPVVDEDTAKVVPESKMLRTGLQSTGYPCALPRAATVGKAGLFVTCLGEDTVSLYDADALNPQDIGLRKWSVPAGPTAIALDEEHDRAIVWSQFAHALTSIAIGHDGDAAPRAFALSSVTVAHPPEDERVARGRLLFHSTTDRRISSDGRACASCHPDGRDDTLVWSSPKGPRQTPILAGRLDGAAPFGWNGDAPDVSKHLVSTVKRLGGSGLEGPDKEALIAYVRAMKPPPAPEVAEKDAIARGAAVFRSDATGCATCHGAGGDLPDGSAHDVKSRRGADVQAKFDTPSLRFLGGSAPYFHDGRYPDLKTLLVKSDGKMGHTKHLSRDDLADLTTYLETL